MNLLQPHPHPIPPPPPPGQGGLLFPAGRRGGAAGVGAQAEQGARPAGAGAALAGVGGMEYSVFW